MESSFSAQWGTTVPDNLLMHMNENEAPTAWVRAHTHTHVSPGNKNTWLVNILDIKKKQKAVFMNFRVGPRAGGQLHCNGISEFSDVMLSRVTWLTGWDRQMWNEADLEFMLSVAKGNSQYGGPAIGWVDILFWVVASDVKPVDLRQSKGGTQMTCSCFCSATSHVCNGYVFN